MTLSNEKKDQRVRTQPLRIEKVDPFEIIEDKEGVLVTGRIELTPTKIVEKEKPIMRLTTVPLVELGEIVDEPIIDDEDCMCGDCDRCVRAKEDQAAQIIDDDPEPFVKISGPAAQQLVESTVKPKSGTCPTCGHTSADTVGTQIKCVNCSRTVILV
jgi:hypothetical protein